MRKQISSALVLCGLMVSTLVAPAFATTAGYDGEIKGTGASFQNDFQQACLTKFNSESKVNGGKNLGVRVSYTMSDSGAGRTDVANGTSDFAGSDSSGEPTSTNNGKMLKADHIYIPIAGAPVAFFFNVKAKGSNTTRITGLKLNASVLSLIFRGDITAWDDSRIKDLNSTVASKLPSTSIIVNYRAGDSGTSKNLFKFFNKMNGGTTWGDADGVWATGMKSTTIVGNSNVGGQNLVNSVAATNGSIGYADLSDTTGKTISMVSLYNPNGAGYVLPSGANATKFLNGTVGGTSPVSPTSGYDGNYTIDWSKATSGSYPFTILTYLFVAKPSSSWGNPTATRASVKAYATYVVKTCSSNPAGIGQSGFVKPGTVPYNKALAQLALL